MSCVHLQTLFQLCEDNQIHFSSTDMVRIVCDQCQHDEVCPSMLMDQYESKHADVREGSQDLHVCPTTETAESDN